MYRHFWRHKASLTRHFLCGRVTLRNVTLKRFLLAVGPEERLPVDDVGIAHGAPVDDLDEALILKGGDGPLHSARRSERPTRNELLARIAGALSLAGPIYEAGKNGVFSAVEIQPRHSLFGLPLRSRRRVMR